MADKVSFILRPAGFAMIGMPVESLEPGQFVDRLNGSATAGLSATVCVPNVRECVEAFDNPDFAEIPQSAVRVMPDSAVCNAG